MHKSIDAPEVSGDFFKNAPMSFQTNHLVSNRAKGVAKVKDLAHDDAAAAAAALNSDY
eukprot:SAG31_NODE_12688_length_924_cov_0.911515_1_plen_58_part_00